MNQLELNNRAASILDEAEQKLRGLVLEASAAIQAEFKRVGQEIKTVMLTLENGEKAEIDRIGGAITIEGQKVGDILQLSRIVTALHKAPGLAEAAVKDAGIKTEVNAINTVDAPVNAVDTALKTEAAKLDSEIK